MTIKGNTIRISRSDVEGARLGDYGKSMLQAALEMAGYLVVFED